MYYYTCFLKCKCIQCSPVIIYKCYLPIAIHPYSILLTKFKKSIFASLQILKHNNSSILSMARSNIYIAGF